MSETSNQTELKPASDSKSGVTPLRRSWIRNSFTFIILIICIALIGGYIYITDSERVRRISESYLNELTYGHVKIGGASLSIFEGLKLEDIEIYTDKSGRSESKLMQAKSLQINYSPKALLSGKIEATRIMAIEPHVYLVENVDDGEWNFQKLTKSSGGSSGRSNKLPETSRLELPEILLRSAQVEYSQLQKGKQTGVGSLTLEGQLIPDLQNIYRFRVQTRGGSSGVFPVAEGWLAPGGDQLGVVLRDVEFVDEIKTIMPAVVRKFWEDHALSGRMSETRVSYFRKESGKPGFKVETQLSHVKLTIPPSQWMDRQERFRIDRWKRNFTRLSLPVLGSSTVARSITGAMIPGSLQLDQVDGTFVFTDEQIRADSLVGRIENNRFKITGKAEGYAPDAPFAIRIESLKSENIFIPDSPRYITSMPWPVQQIYYRFVPKGSCSFWIDLKREIAGSTPKLTGELAIHDTSFKFDRFPYPIEHANGILRFGNDPATGREMLEIVSIIGHGYTGGANENATLEVNGKISPLDNTSGASITVKGRNMVSEPLLIESMPPKTRKTVKGFDPKHTGKLPVFAGDFDCNIECPIGINTPWLITTSISLHDGAGVVAAFPYPLKNLSAKLIVHDDHIELPRATMPKGDGSVEIFGLIDWRRHDKITGEPLVQPDLKLVARGVPIDEELLSSLTESKQKWMRKLQLTGKLDITGTINCPNPESEDSAFNAEIKLQNGTAKIGNGAVELKQIEADMKLTPGSLTISSAKGLRDKASVNLTAALDLSKEDPEGSLVAHVNDLRVDEKLLSFLSDDSRSTIADLQPNGTVDLDLTVSNFSSSGYRVALRPKELSFQPKAFPLKLNKTQGEIIANGSMVTLKDVVLQSDDAIFRVNGSIEPESGKTDIALAGRNLKLTDDLKKRLPPMMQRLLKSVELKGTVAFDLEHLKIKPDPNATTAPSGERASDVEFDGKLWLQNATMDAGVAMTDINGLLTASGKTRGGALQSLTGTVSFDSLKLAGRDVSWLTAEINKPADKDVIQLLKIDGRIADGTISGQIDSILSEKDPRFGMNLVLRNAKVADITGETDKPIDGRLTASLSMEGKWSDASASRGRGDVLVEGKQMYRVPILFGLMQMANLSLPFESPIQQAGIRYNIDGQTLQLETMDLRGKTSAMQGSGTVDFKSKQVQMTLYVVNQAADSVPIFGQLLKGAREDFMQVRVRGTIQEPKVGAGLFNTFSTTIDEVMKGKE